MVAPEKRGGLWDTEGGCECIGASENIENIKDKTDE